MKTLKKTLCLVLAVVMVVGVLILPAYAADDDYTDAIKTLQSYGVLQGYPDGGLHTDANITRGQMAAIIYRIMTGDTESTDDEVATLYGNYADIFTDANVAPWAKGYIGFCSNRGVLKGYPGGTVQANKQISGYEVQAMLLRALGYDKKDYTGDNWQYNVLADATQAGITAGMTKDPSKVTPRGAVAQMAYNAACKSVRVQYSDNAKDYIPMTGAKEHLIKVKSKNTSVVSYDKWGVPSQEQVLTFTWPNYTKQSEVSIPAKLVKEYYTAVTQCDLTEDVNGGKDFNAIIVTNGYTTTNSTPKAVYKNANNIVNETIKATNTSTKLYADGVAAGAIGAQGRYTAVYENPSYDGDTVKDKFVIVEIDTLLAKVIKVTPPEADLAGHPNVKAELKLQIYDGKYKENSEKGITDDRTFTVTQADAWPYAVGDYVLVNAWQSNGTKYNRAVGEVFGPEASGTLDQYIVVLGKAEYADLAQDIIYKNENKHHVGDEDVADNYRYTLDQAGEKTGTYRWYYDGQGNLLGSTEVLEAKNYGVVTNLWWVNDISNGKGAAYAEITDMNGEKSTVVLASVDVWDGSAWYAGTPIYRQGSTDTMNIIPGTKATFDVSTTATNNKGANSFVEQELYEISIADGKATLKHVDELAPARIDKGNPIVGGTPGKDSVNAIIYVNESTQWLMNNGKTFTATTGFAASKITGATVDYKDVDKDGYADYVYVIYTPATAEAVKSDNLVYIVSSGLKETLGADGVKTYTILHATDKDGKEITIDTESVAIASLLNGNAGGLFYVEFEDDVATGACLINNADANREAHGARYLGTNLYLKGGVLSSRENPSTSTSADFAVNITNATKWIYKEQQIVEPSESWLAGKHVYVIYDEDLVNVAAGIYIVDSVPTAATRTTAHEVKAGTVEACTPDEGVALADIAGLIIKEFEDAGIKIVSPSMTATYTSVPYSVWSKLDGKTLTVQAVDSKGNVLDVPVTTGKVTCTGSIGSQAAIAVAVTATDEAGGIKTGSVTVTEYAAAGKTAKLANKDSSDTSTPLKFSETPLKDTQLAKATQIRDILELCSDPFDSDLRKDDGTHIASLGAEVTWKFYTGTGKEETNPSAALDSLGYAYVTVKSEDGSVTNTFTVLFKSEAKTVTENVVNDLLGGLTASSDPDVVAAAVKAVKDATSANTKLADVIKALATDKVPTETVVDSVMDAYKDASDNAAVVTALLGEETGLDKAEVGNAYVEWAVKELKSGSEGTFKNVDKLTVTGSGTEYEIKLASDFSTAPSNTGLGTLVAQMKSGKFGSVKGGDDEDAQNDDILNESDPVTTLKGKLATVSDNAPYYLTVTIGTTAYHITVTKAAAE